MQESKENGEFCGPEFSFIRDQIFLNKIERVPIIMQDLVESVRKAGSGDMLGALVTQTSAILELAGMLQVVVKDVITHQNVCQKYKDDYEKMGMRVKTVEKKLQLLEYYQKHKKFDTASVGINTEEISFPQSSSLSELPFPVSSESPAPFIYHQVVSDPSHQNVYRIRPRKSRTSSLSSLSRSDSPSNSYPIPSSSISPECTWSHQTPHCKSPQILFPHSTLDGSEQYNYQDFSQPDSVQDTSSAWQENYFPSPYNDDIEDYDICDQQDNHLENNLSHLNTDSTLNQEESILNDNNLGLIINNVCSLRGNTSIEKLTVYDWVDDDLTGSGSKTTGFSSRNKKAKLVTANYLKSYPYAHIINTKMKKKNRKKRYKPSLINCTSPVLCKSKNTRVIPYYKKSLQRQKCEIVPNVRKSLRIRFRKLTNVIQSADEIISPSKTKKNAQPDGNSNLTSKLNIKNNNFSSCSGNGHFEKLSDSIPLRKGDDNSNETTTETLINEVTIASEVVKNAADVLSPDQELHQQVSEKETAESENVVEMGNSSSDGTNAQQTATEYIPEEVKTISNKSKDIPIDTHSPEDTTEVLHEIKIMVPQEGDTELGIPEEGINLKETSDGKKIVTLEETNLPTIKIILKDVMKLNKIHEYSESLKIDKMKLPKTSKTKLVSDSIKKITKSAKENAKRKEVIKKVTCRGIKNKINQSHQELAYKASIKKNPNSEGGSISSGIVNTSFEEHTLSTEVMGQENRNELIQKPDNREGISTGKEIVCVLGEKRGLSQEVVNHEIIGEIISSCKGAEDELCNIKQSDAGEIVLGNVITSVQEVLPGCKELVTQDIREKINTSQKETNKTLPVQESSMKRRTSLSKETVHSSTDNTVLNEEIDNVVLKEISVDKEIFDSKQSLKRKDNIQCVNEDDNEAKIPVGGTHSINLSIADMARLLDSDDDDENSNKEYVFVSSDLANVDSSQQVFVFETAEAINLHPQNVIEDEDSTSSIIKDDDEEKLATLKMKNIFETVVTGDADLSTNITIANDSMESDHLGQNSLETLLKHNDYEPKGAHSSNKETNDADDSAMMNVDGELKKLVSQPVQSFSNGFESESVKNISTFEANISCHISSMDRIRESEAIVSKISDNIRKDFERENLVSASEEIENPNNLELTHNRLDSSKCYLIQDCLKGHENESIKTKSINTKLDQFSRISPISFQKKQLEDFTSTSKANRVSDSSVDEISNDCRNSKTQDLSKDTDPDLVLIKFRLSLDQSVNHVSAPSDTLMIKPVESFQNDSKKSKEQQDETSKVLQDVIITDSNSEAHQLMLGSTIDFETIPENKPEQQALNVEKMAAFVNPTTETHISIQAESDHSNLIPVKTLANKYQSKQKDFSSRSKKALSSPEKHSTGNSPQISLHDLSNHQMHLNLETTKIESSHHHSLLTSDNPLIELSQSLFNSKDTLFQKPEKGPDNLISQQAKSIVELSCVNIDHLEASSLSREDICKEVIPKKLSVDRELKEKALEDSSESYEHKKFQNFCYDDSDDDDEISFKNVPWIDNSCSIVPQALAGYVSDVEDNSNNTGHNLKNGFKSENQKKHKHLNENSKLSSQIKTRSVKQPFIFLSPSVNLKPETGWTSGCVRKKMKNSSQLPDCRKFPNFQDMPVSQMIDKPDHMMHLKSSAVQSKAILPQASLVNSSTKVHSLCASNPGSAIQVPLESKASTRPDYCTLFTSDESDTSESFAKVPLKWISNNESNPGSTTREQHLTSNETSLSNQIMEQLESLKDSTSSPKFDDPSAPQNKKLSQSTHDISQQNSKLFEKLETKGRVPQILISPVSTENSFTTLKSRTSTTSDRHLQNKKKQTNNLKKHLANKFSKGIFSRKCKKLKNEPKSKTPKTDVINSKKLIEKCSQISDCLTIWKKLEILKQEKIKIVKFKNCLYKQVAEIAVPNGFIVIRSRKGVVVSRGSNPVFSPMKSS